MSVNNNSEQDNKSYKVFVEAQQLNLTVCVCIGSNLCHGSVDKRGLLLVVAGLGLSFEDVGGSGGSSD